MDGFNILADFTLQIVGPNVSEAQAAQYSFEEAAVAELVHWRRQHEIAAANNKVLTEELMQLRRRYDCMEDTNKTLRENLWHLNNTLETQRQGTAQLAQQVAFPGSPLV